MSVQRVPGPADTSEWKPGLTDGMGAVAAGTEEPGRMVLVPASCVPVEAVDWLVPNLWPVGFLSVLAGVGGLGKSTYSYRLAADVTTGATSGSWAGTPRSVVVFSAEDTWKNVIKPRLIAAGADLHRVLFVASMADAGDPFPLDIPGDLNELEQAINKRDDVALIIFDPLVAFVGDGTDTHRDHSTRRALRPLGDFAARTGTAVLGVMHLNKGDGTDLYHRLSMSTAFYNTVRSAALFAEDPDDPNGPLRILAQDKNNLSAKAAPTRWRIEPHTIHENGVTVETSRLTFVEVADIDATTLLAGKEQSEAPKTALAAELIEQLWVKYQGSVPAGTVEERVAEFNDGQPTDDDRISFRTFRRALNKLGGVARREMFGSEGKWMWVPPKGYFDA